MKPTQHTDLIKGKPEQVRNRFNFSDMYEEAIQAELARQQARLREEERRRAEVVRERERNRVWVNENVRHAPFNYDRAEPIQSLSSYEIRYEADNEIRPPQPRITYDEYVLMQNQRLQERVQELSQYEGERFGATWTRGPNRPPRD